MSETSERVLARSWAYIDEAFVLAREVEQLEAKLAEARDCGQSVVCVVPPGCQRHWEERCRELVGKLAEVTTALASLVGALPKCQVCGLPGTREDCNCLLACENNAHACGEDGGPRDVPWAPAVRAAIAILDDDKGET